MPISSVKLVYDFKRKYNAINSGKNKDIQLVDIVALLNEGLGQWFRNQLKYEHLSREVRDGLRPYLKSKVKLACEKIDDNCCLARYPDDLYRRKNQIATTSKEGCPSKEIIVRIVSHDDLHEARANPMRRSDFYFEQLLGVESEDGIIVYHDNAMGVSDVVMDYYRKPKDLHAPSLVECEGPYYYDYYGTVITKDQDLETDNTYAEIDIVNLAVLFGSRDTMDYDGFQTQLNRILQAPKLGVDL